jgi:hypothetical protein
VQRGSTISFHPARVPSSVLAVVAYVLGQRVRVIHVSPYFVHSTNVVDFSFDRIIFSLIAVNILISFIR